MWPSFFTFVLSFKSCVAYCTVLTWYPDEWPAQARHVFGNLLYFFYFHKTKLKLLKHIMTAMDSFLRRSGKKFVLYIHMYIFRMSTHVSCSIYLLHVHYRSYLSHLLYFFFYNLKNLCQFSLMKWLLLAYWFLKKFQGWAILKF